MNSGKSVSQEGEFVVEISHRKVTFLPSRELVMELHATGTRLRSEHSFEAEPDITGCGALDNMGKHGFRERGDESTQDHLILGVPGIKIRIGKYGCGARSLNCKRGWRGGLVPSMKP
uniref:Uncharacterized protein n=1 Tax=Fagus sylvatica TaxID=28930 RepID=A0A2N9I153_FAGSY